MLAFRRLRYKNFLSTGNVWNEYKLDTHPTTLIVGTNGAGKTTMLDALCFGLYGRGFRNINKGNFVNSINEKGLVVEVEFETQNNTYLIRRGIKPAVFDVLCDGELIPAFPSSTEMQDHVEKYILQCNFKAFTQVVILGASSYVPFMRLTPAARREILEDVLDIEVFSVMQSLAKDRLARTRERLTVHQGKKAVAESQHALVRTYTDQWTQQQEARRATIETQLAALQSRAESLTTDHTDYMTRLEEPVMLAAMAKIPDYEAQQAKAVKLRAKFSAELQHLELHRQFFTSHDQCPTCTQTIDATFKGDKLTTTDAAVEKLKADLVEAATLCVAIDARLQSARNAQHVHRDLIQSVKYVEQQMQTCARDLTRLTAEHTETFATPPPPPTELGDLVVIQASVDKHTHLKHVQEHTINLLKDTGIRTRIIQQYLPVINHWVNHYLRALNFPIQFTLDEQFTETIKSRHRDEFSYESFSEGEKRRIDLALVLTWRAIARMKNSVYTNLLIFDEVFDSSLDSSGTDDFLALLQTLGNETNVFVISHKTDVLIDRFSTVVMVTKERGFSLVNAV